MLPTLRRHFRCSFVSLIENTVHEVQARHITQLAIIASPTTIHTGLYQKPLQAVHINVLTPSATQLAIIEEAIRSVIAGLDLRKPRMELEGIIHTMSSSGAEAVLLGCTELSVLFPEVAVTRIDPLHIICSVLVEAKAWI